MTADPLLFDTHCHLTDEAFTADRAATITRAFEAGVSEMMVVCCEGKEFAPIVDLCQQYPGALYPTLGLHPENLPDDVETALDALHTLLQQTIAAHTTWAIPIGEIGLDLHYGVERLADQRFALRRQLEWAVEYHLPVLLHIREAMPEFLALLTDFAHTHTTERLRGILHCYSGTLEEARQAFQLGDFYLGIGGTLTYKKSLLPDVVQAVGLSRLVLETDSPYLAPVPQRGHRNEPAYVRHTAEALARLLHTPLEEVIRTTTHNAHLLFGL